MSKLKELVPPLNLCELIPEGEFEDTAFYHLVLIKSTDEYSEIISSKDKYLFKNDPNVKIYPAPTFVEIIDDMPAREMQKELLYAFDRTERVLKLWLKYKGIDYESKTCGECKFYQKKQSFWCLAVSPEHEACEEFEPKDEKDEK